MFLNFLNGDDVWLELLNLVGDPVDIGSLRSLQIPAHDRQPHDLQQ